MPELPEVETVRRGLEKKILHATLRGVTLRRPDLRFPIPPALGNLQNTRLNALRRRAKYLLMDFDNGQTVLVHLGMSGRLVFADAATPPAKHDHVLFHFDGEDVRFNDARRFGVADMYPTVQEHTVPALAALGPEPLTDAFDGKYLLTSLKGKKSAIKTAIMDNTVVVGVGNIYASESLFRAGILPARAAGKLTRAQTDKLAGCIKDVLTEAIAAGGSSLKDYVQTDGSLGYFAHRFRVYGRDGQLCTVCGTSIRKVIIGQRSTFFCPVCQK
ncbi:MAG: bifunctional DNA-formamidopyrimidine glycosylase/DNA-(apurinic or apyrimidinic site) lyase [Proteobacteria bacterium]|nr:bifunctional DNA-formamidopyrimidine glycosylase/DNA-(apurinic or apyrimidinic site) lyase [Pseudomonadota bacterium]